MALGLGRSQIRFSTWHFCVAPLALVLAACGVETGAIHDTPADDSANGSSTPATNGGDDSADAGAATTATTGTGSSASPANDGGAATTSTPAFDGGALLPQVVSSGGYVLAAPHFVAMTFDSYAYRAAVESFVDNVGHSAFWTATTSEYGIGAGSAGPVVHLAGNGGSACGSNKSGTCIDDAAIKSLVLNQFSVGAAKYDPNTVYALVFPASVTIERAGTTSCTDFAGYHDQVAMTDGTYAVYAVVPTCPSSVAANVSTVDIVTAELGHELIDAASDPLPETSPAYKSPADSALGWIAGGLGVSAGTELADLCAVEAGSYVADQELPDPSNANAYQYVQRSWSNAAAALGQDPCVPHLAAPYFNAVAVPTDMAAYSYAKSDGTTGKANLEVASFTSATKTVAVQLIGDVAAGPFTVRAVDYAGVADSLVAGSAARSYFTFTWDNGKQSITGTAGQIVHLTITATAEGLALASVAASASLGVKDYPFLPVWIGATATDASGHSTEHLSFLLTDVAASTNAVIGADAGSGNTQFQP